MGWIRERILSEYKKHGERLDWALLAEKKIKAQLREMIKEAPDRDYVGEYLMKMLNLNFTSLEEE